MIFVQTYPSNHYKNRRLFFFKLSRVVAFTALMLGLASCGGGGASNTPSNTPQPATITSIVPVGIVASTNSQSLSIGVMNFSNGMTVSVADKNGKNYSVNSVVASSSTVITANVIIPSAPNDKYVNVAIKSSTGTTLASITLGVASTPKTLASDVYPILDTKCRGCHTGTANGNLDFSSYAITASANPTGLIGIPSYLCSPTFRVSPGDPRPTSNVLINKIQASNIQPPCNGNPMPPPGSQALTTQEIQTIIDWVAGGAN